jgi:hypothetical protein
MAMRGGMRGRGLCTIYNKWKIVGSNDSFIKECEKIKLKTTFQFWKSILHVMKHDRYATNNDRWHLYQQDSFIGVIV